ncbi:MAG: hypothetical protein IIA88_00675 [Bacteroidetes bacterium]|nr:hypothetical protein [Bacteroidota bacterium]
MSFNIPFNIYFFLKICIFVPLLYLIFLGIVRLTDFRQTYACYSYSIRESKRVGAFVAEYEIISYDHSINDSIIKYKLDFRVETISFWVEKSYNKVPSFFLYSIEFRDNYFLSYINPTHNQFLSDKKIYFDLVKKDEDCNTSLYQELSLMNLEMVPDSIVLSAFLFFDSQTNCSYIGDIVLKKKMPTVQSHQSPFQDSSMFEVRNYGRL